MPAIFDVVDVGAAALDQARVLAPLDALADELRQDGSGGHGLPLVRSVLNGVDDVLVAGAAAEIAGDAFADLALGRRRVVVQQVDGRHDHAGRAEAALQAVLLPEALLQRVQLAVLVASPSMVVTSRAVGLDREHRAGLRRCGRRRARCRRRTGWCRSRRACRSGADVRGGSGRAGCAARRGLSRLPLTVIATSIMEIPSFQEP